MTSSHWPRGFRRWGVSLNGNGISCYAMARTKTDAIRAVRSHGLKPGPKAYANPDGNRIADGNGGWISQAELLMS